jgi:hypothetical protein
MSLDRFFEVSEKQAIFELRELVSNLHAGSLRAHCRFSREPLSGDPAWP